MSKHNYTITMRYNYSSIPKMLEKIRVWFSNWTPHKIYVIIYKCLYPSQTVLIKGSLIYLTNKEMLNYFNDVIIGTIASQITSFTIVYSIVCSDADQRYYQSSASLVFVRGIHRVPLNSPHKWPVTRKMFPFDDVIMYRDIGLLFNPVHYRLTAPSTLLQ